MDIRFYDTYQGKVVPFAPRTPGRVGLYTCGPTVYDYAHIGNFRAYVWEDLLRRFLEYTGFRVTHVMNITDVDDKTIKGAQAQGVALDAYTEPYIAAFHEDLNTLRCLPAHQYPRATRHIPEMVELVRKLEANGHTYAEGGDIYFRIASWADYGRLSKIDLSQVRQGERVSSDEYEKEDVRDFALWKAVKPEEDASGAVWETALGTGRPGWHLECSAMSMQYLGEAFDLHTGAVDNIFPHHENEIAQSVAGTGQPFVKYWLHCAHLIVDGQKMSKSLGNFHTLRDLLARDLNPVAIRYLLLGTHYRKQLNFTLDGLTQAEEALARVADFVGALRSAALPADGSRPFGERIETAERQFAESLADDLNIAEALAALFNLIREGNVALRKQRLSQADREAVLATLGRWETVLGVLGPALAEGTASEVTLSSGQGYTLHAADPLDPEVQAEVVARAEARLRKDFAEADRLRDALIARGLVLEDIPGGIRIKR